MNESEPAEKNEYTLDDVVHGLNQMRNTLVHLSTLIKDYRAQIDWQLQGEGLSASREAICKAKNTGIRSD